MKPSAILPQGRAEPPRPAGLLLCLCALLCALAAPGRAEVRGSVNYLVATEVLAGGGGRSSSASYTQDASLGPVGSVSTAAPATTAKQGYIAQLYDAVGLTVSAPTASVNEAASLQLSAAQLLDDDTFLAVDPNAVAWGVTGGPISGISGGGLATAQTVPQDTAAGVQGILGAFTGSLVLTVLDSVADNFGTYAGDGLGDDWQVQFFGQPPNALAGPLVDADGDGQHNAFEFTAGLVPTDVASRFRLRVEPVPGQPTQKRVVFSPRLAGRTYTVMTRPSLAGGTFTALGSTNTSDLGDERTVTDLAATGPAKFYRVDILRP